MKGLKRAAARRGYETNGLRARQVSEKDFEEFHYILGRWTGRISRYCNESAPRNTVISWACSCSTAKGFRRGTQEVPDPYFGGHQKGFEHVLNLVEEAGQGLLNRIQNERRIFPEEREHIIQARVSGSKVIVHPTFYSR